MPGAPASVWVLADHRPGNVNQALGIAEALGFPFTVKTIRYNALAALPNWVLGATRTHVEPALAAEIAPPWPRVVIAAGRRTAPVARYIGRRSGAYLVQCMWPGPPCDDIDLIVVPEHDRIPDVDNTVRTVGAVNRIAPEILAADADRWRPRVAHLPRPWITLLAGGGRAMVPDQAALLGHHVSALARAVGGALLVTTSPRTGTEATSSLMATIAAPAYRHIWDRAGDNPYRAFLGLADIIVVTGDSVSMCSEACSTGKPVYIHAPPRFTVEKHARFHRSLYKRGCARPLPRTPSGFAPWRYAPLREARRMAAEIRRRLAAEAGQGPP